MFTTFFERYSALLAENPEALALVDDGHSYTRGELDAAANEVAVLLKQRGIGAGKINVIVSERNAQAYIEMLGTWKAGAGFVACESSMPPERLAYIQRDVADYSGKMPPAFVVYTSGSTGTPKRIVHGFGTLDLMWRSDYVNLEPVYRQGDAYCGSVPLTTVAAIIQFVLVLTQGTTFYVAPADVAKDPDALSRYYVHHRINGAFLPTSLARRMPAFGPDFRWLIIGSESSNGFTLEGVDVFDFYASSESGFIVLINGVPFGEGNVRVDDGEIVFDNAYLINLEDSNTTTYHTGDAGKVNEDGTIQVLGRLDEQIKIGGNRIEPAEIEMRAGCIPGIKDVCARGYTDQYGSFIVLFFTATQNITAACFENAFLETLPLYMFPLACVRLKTFPLLPHGKIDRKLLDTMPKEEIIPLSKTMDSLGRTTALVRLANFTRNETAIAEDDAARICDLPLTVYQQFYLESELEHEDGLPLNLLFEIIYDNPMWTRQQIQDAWRIALANHPAFRMMLHKHGDDVVQRYHPECEFDVALDVPRPFQMFDSPLTRVAFQEQGASTRVLLEMHHIITDGYSMVLLVQDVERILSGMRGKGVPTASHRRQHRDGVGIHPEMVRDFYCSAVKRICEWQASQSYARALESFQQEATGDWCTKPPFETTGIEGNLVDTIEMEEDNSKLATVPTWKLIAAALKALHMVTGRNRIAISYTHNGRINVELSSSCGFLLTNYPIRFVFADDTTDAELEDAVKRQLNVTQREAWCPYGAISSDNWDNTGYDDDFLEIYDNRQLYSALGSGYHCQEIESVANIVADTACELYICGPNSDQVYLNYNSSLYTPDTMKKLFVYFVYFSAGD